jgi:hypothetical protein
LGIVVKGLKVGLNKSSFLIGVAKTDIKKAIKQQLYKYGIRIYS